MKKCPNCCEKIFDGATRCPYCDYLITESDKDAFLPEEEKTKEEPEFITPYVEETGMSIGALIEGIICTVCLPVSVYLPVLLLETDLNPIWVLVISVLVFIAEVCWMILYSCRYYKFSRWYRNFRYMDGDFRSDERKKRLW